jgi:hypothetical protein
MRPLGTLSFAGNHPLEGKLIENFAFRGNGRAIHHHFSNLAIRGSWRHHMFPLHVVDQLARRANVQWIDNLVE